MPSTSLEDCALKRIERRLARYVSTKANELVVVTSAILARRNQGNQRDKIGENCGGRRGGRFAFCFSLRVAAKKQSESSFAREMIQRMVQIWGDVAKRTKIGETAPTGKRRSLWLSSREQRRRDAEQNWKKIGERSRHVELISRIATPFGARVVFLATKANERTVCTVCTMDTCPLSVIY